MKLIRKKRRGGGQLSKAFALSLFSLIFAVSLSFAPFASAQTANSTSDALAPTANVSNSDNSNFSTDSVLQAEEDSVAINDPQNDPQNSLSGQDESSKTDTSLSSDGQANEAQNNEAAPVANSGNSVDVPFDKNKKNFFTVSTSDVSCIAGEKATITLSIYAKDGDVKKNENSFSVSSVTIPGAGSVSFSSSGLSSDVKKNSTVNLSFTANIPKTAAGGTFPVTVTVKNKDGLESTLTFNLAVNAVYAGVVCISATEAGSQLSGYKAEYNPESVAFSFDTFNYDSGNSDYTWSLKLEASTEANGELVDVSSSVNPQWAPVLPGSAAQGIAGSGVAESSKSTSSVVKIDTSAIDPDKKNVIYRATLKIIDIKTGNTTEQSATVYRQVNDLSNHEFVLNNVGGSKGHPTQSSEVYDTKVGTDWFDSLYYDNVAKDSRVPFSDADSFRTYLSSVSSDQLDNEFYKYIYDLYNSNSSLNKGTDYADSTSSWYKDNNTPFHAVANAGVNNLSYSLADGGVTYSEDYFANLQKQAQVTGREGEISISADAKPQPREPRVYLIRTQGSWQMFDMEHALSDDGSGVMYSSINELATYYDLKQALLRFSDFLEEKSGGSVALGFLTFSHAGEYSMFLKNGYLSNDPEIIEKGIRGWDTFGDCEHSHYSDGLLNTVLSSIPNELSNWKDKDGNSVANQVKKTAIFIGGPCEPTEKTDGYKVSLPQDLLASNMDHTYGIQTVNGTSNVKDKNGAPIQSWLDYSGDGKDSSTDNRALWQKPGNGFYVAPSEDDIYNALVDIYNKDAQESVTKYGNVNASIIDTVQKEFKVTGATATWISEVDGSISTIPSDSIHITENTDGTTTVTCDYGECKGTGSVKLNISIAAQDDYIGGNNDLTNVDVPKLTFSGKDSSTGEIQNFEKEFADKPSVNVSLFDLNTAGGQGTHQVGEEFNLADYAEADLKDLLTGYSQTNGTLNLEWVETDEDGNELPNQTITFTPGSYRIDNGELTGATDIVLPSCAVNSDEVKTRHFKLKATYTPDVATNGLVDVGSVSSEAKVTLNWIDQKMVALSIHKVVAGEENAPLENVGFALYEDSNLSTLANVYTDIDLSQLLSQDGVLTSNEGYASFYGLEIGKTYYLKEIKAAAGYSLSSQTWTITVKSDSEVEVNGQVAPGSLVEQPIEFYQAKITIENDKTPSLPITGSVGVSLALLGGVLIATGVCLSARHFKKKKLNA